MKIIESNLKHKNIIFIMKIINFNINWKKKYKIAINVHFLNFRRILSEKKYFFMIFFLI